MDVGAAENRMKTGVDIVAAASLAAAIGWVIYRLFGSLGFDSGVAETAICAAALTFLLTLEGMRRIDGRALRLPLAEFVPPPIIVEAQTELLLTDEYVAGDPIRDTGELLLSHVYRPGSTEQDELLLDDILREIAPDSRVVQLFDAARMPTAGELQANIDRHLRSAGRTPAQDDASQALHDALSELRRSLR